METQSIRDAIGIHVVNLDTLYVDSSVSISVLYLRWCSCVREPRYCLSRYQWFAKRLHKLSIYSSSGFSTLLSSLLIQLCMICSVNIYSLNSSPMNSISPTSKALMFRLLGGTICIRVTRWLLVVTTLVVGGLASSSMALATERG